MKKQIRILVTGAGGFIGHHLVRNLKADGCWVRGADIVHPAFELSAADEFRIADLRDWSNCLEVTEDIDEVYNLAADMGGIGYINSFHASIARNNILINAHMLEASRQNGTKRYLFSSSACVYPRYRQETTDIVPLKEDDAYPADPEPGYGWEKLYAEQMCHYYRIDYGMDVKIVRFHNVYGPLGTFEGGKEKSPAAICRKVALAGEGGEIEIWGDGKQTRSYMYIDDCIEGLRRLMPAPANEPLNLGTDRLVSIDDLVNIICRISGKRLSSRYDHTKPQGVRGRNCDTSRLQQVLGWVPTVSLEAGLSATYGWIETELRKAERLPGVGIAEIAS